MAAKGAFPHLLGAHYALDPVFELFIPGVDGDPEFKSLDQTWRVLEAIDETDVQDVLDNGIIQPIRVRKRKDGKAEVIAGRQRARWIRAANERLVEQGVEPDQLLRIPVILDSTKDEAAVHRKMLSENYHRVEPSPMQKSEDAWKRLQLLGETDPASCSKSSLEAVAVSMRCSTSTVRNYVALQKLSEKAQKAAANRELGLNVLVTLAQLPEAEQDEKLDAFRAAKANGSTSSELLEAARTVRDESDSGSGRTVKEPGGAADAEDKTPPKGLRLAQVKGVLKLALADRKGGAGAGCSLPEDALKLLKVICGDAKPNTVKGLTELLGRVADGEK